MKKLVLALSAATLVVGIAAAVLWKQLQTEREHLDDLRARVTRTEGAQTAALAVAAQASPAELTAAPGNSNAAAPGSPAAATVATAAPSAEQVSNGVAKGVSDVLASAAGQDMTRNVLRATLAQIYPDLAAELRMTPAEADRFMDVLVKQASDASGDMLGMMGGNGPASADAQRKMLEKQLAGEKEIARALGNKYPAWQDYQGTATARSQVAQLRSLLGTGQDALSETQSKPLITALAAEQVRINKEEQNRVSTAVRSSQTINVIEDQLKTMSAGNERLISTASSHLNSNQLDQYKRMVRQSETMLRTMMGAMNTQGNAPGQSGAPR